MNAVVHLVWGPLGPSRLREFLSSYRRHAAGAEHQLVVLFNGVRDDQRSAYLGELAGVDHRLLELERPVQDLVAYRQATARIEHERVCFLNSYSLLLADDWLAKLNSALDQPGVGLVGASGSWQSLRSWQLNIHLLPSPYRAVVPERRTAFEQFQSLESELAGPDGERRRSESVPEQRDSEETARAGSQRRSWAERIAPVLKGLPSTVEQLLRFPGFPDFHVRTNGFMCPRSVFAALRMGKISRKMDAYSLESGRNSLTRQVQSLGLRALVVDRDGAAYEREEWPRSHTFWQSDQERLLIADKQTRVYTNGGFERRRLLSALAWGQQADPGSPDR